jgi:hypothetical protein
VAPNKGRDSDRDCGRDWGSVQAAARIPRIQMVKTLFMAVQYNPGEESCQCLRLNETFSLTNFPLRVKLITQERHRALLRERFLW